MMKYSPKNMLILLFIGLLQWSVYARPSREWHSAQIQIGLKKLLVVGSVLYIAAHPDDENTGVLAFLANEKMLRTGYLSLTRGDGGQNLLGPEKGPLLGAIRTRESLAARAIDGAEQFFSRAIDFGYSSSANETLEIWGEAEVLSDIVWVIRRFRPDIIITRFSQSQKTHGHHTASAILARKAFDAAGDSTRFQEHLKYVSTWQPKRLLWNIPASVIEKEQIDRKQLLALNIGKHNSLLDASYGEIAIQSRSMHKTQGFHLLPPRVPPIEYFQHIAGIPADSALFEGIPTHLWNRVSGISAVDALLRNIYLDFDAGNPSASLPQMVKAYQLMKAHSADFRIALKRKALKKLIRICAGLRLDAISSTAWASPGERMGLTTTIIKYFDFPVQLHRIRIDGYQHNFFPAKDLQSQNPVTLTPVIRLPANRPISNPYWLAVPPKKGLFRISHPQHLGLPESAHELSAEFTVAIAGEKFTFESPFFHHEVDPTRGERYRPFSTVPPVTIHIDHPLYVFPDKRSKRVKLRLRSHSSNISGTLHLEGPSAWQISRKKIPFSFSQRDQYQVVAIKIRPPATPMRKSLKATLRINGQTQPAYQLSEIDYEYLPPLTLLKPMNIKLLRLRIKKTGQRIGYVMGSGDEIPEALRQIGYQVQLLSDNDLEQLPLKRFDAIITGVRAYNTRHHLKNVQKNLLKYVYQGGTLIVQYNLDRFLVVNPPGPYPFTISRNRVTRETAPVQFLDINHSLLTFPNAILQQDLNHWVQERGLYFASQWDKRYQAILSSQDPGETPQKGGLLAAPYGKGYYIYTGYAWFRQLPAGVPGAYRMFVNLISAGKSRH